MMNSKNMMVLAVFLAALFGASMGTIIGSWTHRPKQSISAREFVVTNEDGTPVVILQSKDKHGRILVGYGNQSSLFTVGVTELTGGEKTPRATLHSPAGPSASIHVDDHASGIQFSMGEGDNAAGIFATRDAITGYYPSGRAAGLLNEFVWNYRALDAGHEEFAKSYGFTLRTYDRRESLIKDQRELLQKMKQV
jgi:hypothetical protein